MGEVKTPPQKNKENKMKKAILIVVAVIALFGFMGVSGSGPFLPLFDTSATPYVVKSNCSFSDVSSLANKGSGAANLVKVQIGVCDGTTTTNTAQKVIYFSGTAAAFNKIINFGTGAFTSASTYNVIIDALGYTVAVQKTSGTQISVSTTAATDSFSGVAIGY